MSRPFEARYGGPCAADCGQRIEPGEDVTYVDDELLHADCAERDAEVDRRSTKPEKPCPSCWTVHVGECL